MKTKLVIERWDGKQWVRDLATTPTEQIGGETVFGWWDGRAFVRETATYATRKQARVVLENTSNYGIGSNARIVRVKV